MSEPRRRPWLAWGLLLVMPLAMACPSRANPWTIEKSTARRAIAPGVWQVGKTIRGPVAVHLDLILVDERQCELRVVSNRKREDALALGVLAAKAGAVAACNGGYFHAGGDFGPTGLEIANGNRAGTPEPMSALGGAFVVQEGKPGLLWDAEFKDHDHVTDYVHCNPWLVSEGRVWQKPTKEDAAHRAKRTFILTDGAGRWVLGVSTPVGLAELAQLLTTPGLITELPVVRALNLDGGPSSGIWWRDADGREHGQQPGWAVRNAIVVVPRGKSP